MSALENGNVVKVKVKNIAQSPQKLRLVADIVRGVAVENAIGMMKFLNKKGSLFVKKALESGIANAEDRYGWESKDLYVASISVDEAPTRKWGRAASRGRWTKILKRRSHLNLELKRRV